MSGTSIVAQISMSLNEILAKRVDQDVLSDQDLLFLHQNIKDLYSKMPVCFKLHHFVWFPNLG